jgi:hypothetical protein
MSTVESVAARIMRRLLSPDFDENNSSWGLVHADALGKLRAGWPEDEVIAYLRCIEDVNPLLPEDIALERMEKIRKRVEERS